jgi:SAM-dependent methyltransferase
MTQTVQAPGRPGPGGHALPRLLADSSAYGALTVELLRRAGVEPGMRVLDVGCGPGDSSFAAAAVVGPEGEVLGIDRSHAAVARARSRATRAGLGHVRFANADLETGVLAGGFDAAIGRGVLVHLRRPAAALAQVAAAVEPGGIVAFQELVVSSATTTPRVPLYARVHRLLAATLSAAGLDPDLGRQLHGIFRDAGLPGPSLHLSAPVAHAADPAVHGEVARMLRGVLPLAERLNVASPLEVQIDTLAARLHRDALAADATVFLPSLVGAWTRLPG